VGFPLLGFEFVGNLEVTILYLVGFLKFLILQGLSKKFWVELPVSVTSDFERKRRLH
jgi:hypothetical protein